MLPIPLILVILVRESLLAILSSLGGAGTLFKGCTTCGGVVVAAAETAAFDAVLNSDEVDAVPAPSAQPGIVKTISPVAEEEIGAETADEEEEDDSDWTMLDGSSRQRPIKRFVDWVLIEC